jgi:hypothetical protein
LPALAAAGRLLLLLQVKQQEQRINTTWGLTMIMYSTFHTNLPQTISTAFSADKTFSPRNHNIMNARDQDPAQWPSVATATRGRRNIPHSSSSVHFPLFFPNCSVQLVPLPAPALPVQVSTFHTHLHFHIHAPPPPCSLHFRASLHGGTVLRPLFFEFPADPNTHTLSFQFMWGPAVLVVPVISPVKKIIIKCLAKNTSFRASARCAATCPRANFGTP